MTWSACDRYELPAAPGGLALIQDFLNTRGRARPAADDLLSTVTSAQGWADEALRSWGEVTGRAHKRARLSKADLVELVRARDGFVSALRHRDHDQDPDAAGAGFVAGAELSLTLRPDGNVSVEAAGQGWARIVSAMLLEAHEAQVSDRWRRLKTCRNPRCPGSFYDKSPNNSGAWHDVTTCGNVANLRAARARKRDQGARAVSQQGVVPAGQA